MHYVIRSFLLLCCDLSVDFSPFQFHIFIKGKPGVNTGEVYYSFTGGVTMATGYCCGCVA